MGWCTAKGPPSTVALRRDPIASTIFAGVIASGEGQAEPGTVVVDGETLIDGSATSAEIETLEDTNISRT